MASLNAEKTEQIREILYKHCRKCIPVQELSYAVHEISKNPTEEKINEVQKKLCESDKAFYEAQIVNLQPVISNYITLAMSEIRKIVTSTDADSGKTTPGTGGGAGADGGTDTPPPGSGGSSDGSTIA